MLSLLYYGRQVKDMKEKFEYALLDSGDLMRRAGLSLINNIGKVIAIITVFVASLIMFTDLSFAGFGAKNFTTVVIVMLTASYLIYFSMEDTGEKAGESTSEYKTVYSQYVKIRDEIPAKKIADLREFCMEYSIAELKFRRETLLTGQGESMKDFESFLSGKEFNRKKRRIFKKTAALKSIELTPKTLLSHDRGGGKSELKNPESWKLLKLIAKLIPSTLCMLLTVSIIPNVKENLNASMIIEGILKLSSLPIVAFKGYSTGFFHAKREVIPWIQTKTRLLKAFEEQETKKNPQ